MGPGLRRWTGCALLTLAWAGPAPGEPEASDYKIDQAAPAAEARERMRREIARELDEEAQRGRRDAAQEAARRERAQAEEARRPYPQRLLQARCTPCHAADHYLNQRHGLAGWLLVVARMRWLNGAPLAWDEHIVIARELVRQRPATAADAALETAGSLLVPALPLLLGWAWWRRRRPR